MLIYVDVYLSNENELIVLQYVYNKYYNYHYIELFFLV